jgi:predicted alpha/beta-fold hydrolase
VTGPSFRPAWWLPGAHLQTTWGQIARSRALVALRRERFDTDDGDELWLDHVDAAPGSPRLLVLHGLEGSSRSVYAQGLIALAAGRGWSATALNFRSCARDPADDRRWIPNLRPRLYHSGETADLDRVVKHLAANGVGGSPLLAVAVSLGGNVLLKWLGENPAQRAIAAAAVLSVPYDLGAGARNLEHAIGRIYVRHFLPSLMAKIAHLSEQFPELRSLLDLEAARRARDFWAFDDAATAPLHGFTNAADYYARSSSIGFAARIATPTLCISALDDPFLPREVLDRFAGTASAAVELCVTRRGGHVGFVGGANPRHPRYWAEEAAIEWLAKHLGHESLCFDSRTALDGRL